MKKALQPVIMSIATVTTVMSALSLPPKPDEEFIYTADV